MNLQKDKEEIHFPLISYWKTALYKCREPVIDRLWVNYTFRFNESLVICQIYIFAGWSTAEMIPTSAERITCVEIREIADAGESRKSGGPCSQQLRDSGGLDGE